MLRICIRRLTPRRLRASSKSAASIAPRLTVPPTREEFASDRSSDGKDRPRRAAHHLGGRRPRLPGVSRGRGGEAGFDPRVAADGALSTRPPSPAARKMAWRVPDDAIYALAARDQRNRL